MNWSLLFKRDNSAPVACERLQILLAHERSALGRSNLISDLKEEILAAVSLWFPQIPSGRIRAVGQNQRIIAFNACDPSFACSVYRQPLQVAAAA